MCCYEAGPTGYGLYRQFRSGVRCVVIAPSLVRSIRAAIKTVAAMRPSWPVTSARAS